MKNDRENGLEPVDSSVEYVDKAGAVINRGIQDDEKMPYFSVSFTDAFLCAKIECNPVIARITGDCAVCGGDVFF